MTSRLNWSETVDRWMRSRIQPRASVTLKQRTIYVLPSRSGLMYLIAVGVVLIAAINYAVSLAFGLAFLMLSIWMLGILHTWNNLHGLSLTSLATAPVYCGEEIAFNIMLSRSLHRKYEALEIHYQEDWSKRKPSLEYPMIQVDLVDAGQGTDQGCCASQEAGKLQGAIASRQHYLSSGPGSCLEYCRSGSALSCLPSPNTISDGSV